MMGITTHSKPKPSLPAEAEDEPIEILTGLGLDVHDVDHVKDAAPLHWRGRIHCLGIRDDCNAASHPFSLDAAILWSSS